jgi:hypothetical protein
MIPKHFRQMPWLRTSPLPPIFELHHAQTILISLFVVSLPPAPIPAQIISNQIAKQPFGKIRFNDSRSRRSMFIIQM